MLETTLASSFVPGVNLKGDVAGANWMFLRPSIPADHIACLGVPSASTLATLRRFSGQVTMIAGAGSSALPDGCVDMLLVVGHLSQWRLLWDTGLRSEIRRVLRPDALVYSEHFGILDRLNGALLVAPDAATASATQRFYLTPRGGELHTAIPDADPAMAAYFAQHSLYSETPTVARFKRVLKLVRGRVLGQKAAGSAGQTKDPKRVVDHLLGRHGVVMGNTGARLSANPPEYLQTIAAASGIDLSRFRWALSAKGEYSSRKLLFFLTDVSRPSVGRPTYIAKMVRDAAFSPRLENEHRALARLEALKIGDLGTVPRSVFYGHHAGLAIVGETIVDGVPLLDRTDLAAGCRYLRSAIDWFTTLGVAGAAGRNAAPGETAATVGGLFARFQEIYQLPPEEERFLRRQVEVLGEAGASLPLVMQHGDPGIWNMLATPEGRVAILDWESAEEAGVPLWDLFYFLRTYAVAAARAGGTRDSLAAFTERFVRPSLLGRASSEAVRSYCAAVGVPRPLIEPLFYTCWMHRALKEATRLTPARLAQGRYVSLLRLTIAQSHALQYLTAG
ncbi:MAG: aminoglycoside phosphotransferase family protein [Vicinamibacterales bacterium]